MVSPAIEALQATSGLCCSLFLLNLNLIILLFDRMNTFLIYLNL